MTVKLPSPRNYSNSMHSIETEVFKASTSCSTLTHPLNIAKKQYKSGFTVFFFARGPCMHRAAAWPRGQRVGLTIQPSRVRVPL